MGSPFPGPTFLQSGISGPKRALFLWDHMFPSRKISFIHRNARCWAAIFQNDLLAEECKGYYCCRNFPTVKITAPLETQGAHCKIKRGPQIFTGAWTSASATRTAGILT